MREQIEKILNRLKPDTITVVVEIENLFHQALIDIENVVNKEIKIADDRWKRAERRLADKESE